MRVDALSRLISAFEFYQLREVALRYLSLLGYRNPVLTDGWADGGTDLRALRADGFDSTIVFQVSVEKNWEAKLRSDIAKAVANYSPTTFIYISSRRIPELKFSQIATQFRAQGLSLVKADSQALASSFFENGESSYLLEIAGISDVKRPYTAPSRDFKEEAAYAYLFLSGNVRDFRASVLERALLSRIVEKEKQERVTRESLVDDISAQLGLVPNQVRQVTSAVDRLLVRGDLVSIQGTLAVPEALRIEILTVRALDDDGWSKLEAKLLSIINRHIPPGARGKVSGDRLLGSVGAALVTASALTSTDFSGDHNRQELLPRLRERLQQLAALLTEVGISDASQRSQVLEELIAEASNTPPGQALAAAELFLLLSGLDTSRLARALGMPNMPPIILDASVAIPMFTSLLYRPGPTRYFLAAHQLYQQASSHNVQLKIPKDYLEEVAVHLIDAWRNYLPLLDNVEALQHSTNAYVAHFTYLKSHGRTTDFRTYIKGLGVNPSILDEEDYYEIRRIVMRRLESMMQRYGITTTFHTSPSGASLKAAEKEISVVSRQNGEHRSPTTLRHDKHVIAQMDESSASENYILCSWDRLLLDLHENASDTWRALDPSALCDLLALAAGSAPGESPSLISAATMARALVDEDRHRAAEIWDWLATREDGNLTDADALASAKEFVSQYAEDTKSTRPHELVEAWTAWKNTRSAS